VSSFEGAALRQSPEWKDYNRKYQREYQRILRANKRREDDEMSKNRYVLNEQARTLSLYNSIGIKVAHLDQTYEERRDSSKRLLSSCQKIPGRSMPIVELMNPENGASKWIAASTFFNMYLVDYNDPAAHRRAAKCANVSRPDPPEKPASVAFRDALLEHTARQTEILNALLVDVRRVHASANDDGASTRSILESWAEEMNKAAARLFEGFSADHLALLKIEKLLAALLEEWKRPGAAARQAPSSPVNGIAASRALP
jgi:hypothetical protein